MVAGCGHRLRKRCAQSPTYIALASVVSKRPLVLALERCELGVPPDLASRRKSLRIKLEHRIRKRVRLFCKLIVVLLVALWPAVTSHALLEQAGLIHEVHDDHHGNEGSHEHNTSNHAFADGDYVSANASKSIKKPESTVNSTAPFRTLLYCSILMRNDPPGPAPPDTAPPLLQKSWYFLLRTALPVRAPSFIS